MKTLVTILISVCIGTTCRCQDRKAEFLGELNKVAERYRSAGYISYDIKFLYARAETPKVYLDSLTGLYKSSQKGFQSVIDQTKTVYDGKYALVVYSQDSIIYLSRPNTSLQAVDPVGLHDSLFAGENVQYSLSENKAVKILEVNFDDNADYKKIRYEVDKKTGLLKNVTQVVNSAYMYDREIAGFIAEQKQYSVVEMHFSNYDFRQFDTNIFSTNAYVSEENGRYVARAPYDSYKVFIGSANL